MFVRWHVMVMSAMVFLSTSLWSLPVFAGQCSVTCKSDDGRGVSVQRNFTGFSQGDCRVRCEAACASTPGVVGTPLQCLLDTIRYRADSGDAQPYALDGRGEQPGTCVVVCSDGVTRTTGRVNVDAINSQETCFTRCNAECPQRRGAQTGRAYACFSSLYVQRPTDAVTTGGATTPSTSDGSGGLQATRPDGSLDLSTITQSSFHGVNDPFGGKTIPELVGRIIQFFLGLAGALFLLMFVYGGAMWLTAGDDTDRVKGATKTLGNAVAGVAIVLLSYTAVFGIVRLIGDTGAGQNAGQEQLTAESTMNASESEAGSSATSLPTAGSADSNTAGVDGTGAERGAQTAALESFARFLGVRTSRTDDTGATPSAPTVLGTTCVASAFQEACRARCNNPLVMLSGYQAQCSSACDTYGGQICTYVRTPTDCGTGCGVVCADQRVPSEFRSMCSSECNSLCHTAFPAPTR